MAYIVMAYIAMAYIVTAYTIMAHLYSYGPTKRIGQYILIPLAKALADRCAKASVLTGP